MQIHHLVQPNSTDKIKFLTYTLDGACITKEYGLIGGRVSKPAHSQYPGNNIGKSNEKSPNEVAKAAFVREITKKIKEGYVTVENLEELPVFDDGLTGLDLSNIPTGFCLSKPTAKVTEKTIDELIGSGFARFFVKYNGGCHYVLILPDNEVKVFTRRWDDHTVKYPGIVEAAKVANHPKNTLIAVELCVDPQLNLDHMVAFNLFASISKANVSSGVCKPDQSKSLALQDTHRVRAAVFGYLYRDGDKMWHHNYDVQIGELMADFNPLSSGDTFFIPQTAEFKSGKEALALIKTVKKSIEGFIMWDGRLAMEVTMNGKPKRRAAWKLKARGEMDVIAIAGVEGKVPGEFGSLQICLRDAETGEQVDMGTIGGLKDAEKYPSYWKFPCVVEAGYDNIFPESGLMQFGNFSKVHEDKLLEEVEPFQHP